MRDICAKVELASAVLHSASQVSFSPFVTTRCKPELHGIHLSSANTFVRVTQGSVLRSRRTLRDFLSSMFASPLHELVSKPPCVFRRERIQPMFLFPHPAMWTRVSHFLGSRVHTYTDSLCISLRYRHLRRQWRTRLVIPVTELSHNKNILVAEFGRCRHIHRCTQITT